jgi:hypothetical protein
MQSTCGKSIQIWGDNVSISSTSHVASAHLVSENVEQIRAGWACVSSSV